MAPQAAWVPLGSGAMECHVCGTAVRPEQKFCMECGARLHRQNTGEMALAPPELGSGSDYTSRTPALPPAPGAHPMFDPVTGQLLAQPRGRGAGRRRHQRAACAG